MCIRDSYFPHLDYAAQKDGPDSDAAMKAVADLDQMLGPFIEQMNSALAGNQIDWMVASEYTITPVDHVTFPNRILRSAGLLNVVQTDEGELIDFANSKAWALADHQFSQVYVRDADSDTIAQVVDLFSNAEGFDQILAMDDRKLIGMDHERAGEVVLLSSKNSWQAYYWWNEDSQAPKFARTVDIHKKPGYDPVELHVDMATRSIPLDATLIKGSHGLPSKDDDQKGVLLSTTDVLQEEQNTDTAVYDIVIEHFQN